MKLFGPFDKEDFELFGMSAVALVLTAVALSNPLSVGARSGTFAVSATSQAAAVALTTSGTVSTSPNPVIACPALTRLLARGSRGADVSTLQAHLISEGYLTADSQTGYFGPLTEGALQRWQAKQNIVSSGSPSATGWGVAGPRTRAALLKCRGAVTPPGASDNFSVSPLSGFPPLTVTARFALGSACSPYTLTWGDGENSNYTPPLGVACAQVATREEISHTYSETGSYRVSLRTNSMSASERVKVSSSASENVSFSASPRSGAAPLSVGFTGVTYQNSSYIEFGDGNSQTVSNFADPAANTSSDILPFAESYTYQSPGTYTAKLIYQPPYSCPSGAYCAQVMPAPRTLKSTTVKVTGDSTRSADFSVSPKEGQAPLEVTFKSSTTGSVDFGDGTTGSVNAWSGSCTASFPSTCSYFLTHSYAQAGTYKATLFSAGACSSGYCAQISGTVTITVSSSENNSSAVSAQPQSGHAPLGVVFTVNSASSGTYYIDYGDGSDGQMQQNCAYGLNGSTNCNTSSYFASHSYQSAGTYSATVSFAPACSSSSISCSQALQQIGTTVVTVTNS